MNFDWPIIGHGNIKGYFEKVFNAGNISHAYLFKGPANVGKSTFAKMIAKTLLCSTGTDADKISAQAFDNGAHPDLIILDKGEDACISIEATLEFIKTIATRPLLGVRNIGIIEEVPLMTHSAASALLKTLEEPCAKVTLFLITDRPVISTIESRCQIINFSFVPEKDVEKALDCEHGVQIARLSGGRPGKALELSKDNAFEQYQSETDEVAGIIGKGEGKRLLWIHNQFGGISKLVDMRVFLLGLIEKIEVILRDCIRNSVGLGEDNIINSICNISIEKANAMLKRCAQARVLVGANVDPKLVCEYILLDHEII